MDILARFHDYSQEIVGGIDVVIHRVALIARVLHRIRRGALFCEMHDGIWAFGIDEF